MTAPAIHATLAPRLARNLNAIAVIGDSGTGKVFAQLQSLLPSVVVENRGVGGTNMQQIATKFRTEQLWRSSMLVVCDLSGDDLSRQNTYYPQIISDIRRPQPRYLIVQPGVAADAGDPSTHGNYIGGANRANIEAMWASVAANAGDFYVPTMQPLWDANDGSAGDLADVANGIMPRSLREPGDGLHWNDAGALVVAQQVVARATALGWFA